MPTGFAGLVASVQNLFRGEAGEEEDLSFIANFYLTAYFTFGRKPSWRKAFVKQELRDPSTYNSVIGAIAGGASKMNEIATKAGIETGAASNLLQALIELGIVRKEVPITEKESSRKTIYLLEDQMFRFWYRFVSPNISGIVRGIGSIIYEKQVKPQLNHYMGLVFEEICGGW